MDTSATSSGGAASVSPEVADRWFYKMNHSQRGKAIIFNQMNFANQGTRIGSNLDAENLRKTLCGLGFDVATHTDLKLQDIEDKLDRLAAEDHTESDCLFVAILTHGDEDTVASNDHSFSPHILWKRFSANKCKSLAGKPKIFLLQACRGSDTNESATKKAETNKVLSKMEIPNHGSDVLLICGTIPGFVSYRDEDKGSWLVQGFSRVVNDVLMHDQDFVSIITEVCRVVAEEDQFKRSVIINKNTGESKIVRQMICFTSMLTRKIRFNNK